MMENCEEQQENSKKPKLEWQLYTTMYGFNYYSVKIPGSSFDIYIQKRCGRGTIFSGFVCDYHNFIIGDKIKLGELSSDFTMACALAEEKALEALSAKADEAIKLRDALILAVKD